MEPVGDRSAKSKKLWEGQGRPDSPSVPTGETQTPSFSPKVTSSSSKSMSPGPALSPHQGFLWLPCIKSNAFSLPFSWPDPRIHPMPGIDFVCPSSLANTQFILWKIVFNSQRQKRRDRQKQQGENQQVGLLQAVPPKLSNGHQGVQSSSEKRYFSGNPLQNLSNISQAKLAGMGGKGQESNAHATCQNSKPCLTFEWCKTIPVIQSPKKNMPEVSFMKASHTCLMTVTVRYDTGNLPFKPESRYVQVRRDFYELWWRPQQVIISLITQGQAGSCQLHAEKE